MEEILNDILNQDDGDILDFVRKYFGGEFDLFFQMILDEGVLNEDELLKWGFDTFEGPTVMFFWEKDSDKIIKFIVDNIIMGCTEKNGKITYDSSDPEDIAVLFERPQRKIVERILEGELWDVFYTGDRLDLKSILENLNKENYSYLQNLVLEELEKLKKSEIEVDGEMVSVNKENIDNLSVPELASVIETELSEVDETLQTISRYAEISAWESETITNFRETLGEYMKTENPLSESYITKTTNNKSVEIMVFELDVTNIIGDIIYEITKEDLRYPTESPLANAAYFEKMFEMTIGEMEMDVPDYADWTLQEKYTNEFFRNEL
jgi:ribosomal protein L10